MADPNQGGGNDQQKQKGGGGGAKEGVSLAGNINAATIGGSWPAVRKSIADHSLNALGFIACGIVIAALKGGVYKALNVDEGASAKPKPNAWEGAQAIRELKSSNPDKYKVFAEKNKDIFESATIDVTPAPTDDK